MGKIKQIAVFDIGGTEIKSATFTYEERTTDLGSPTAPSALPLGTLEAHERVPTHASSGGNAVLERIIAMLQSRPTFDSVAISTAGHVDQQEGKIIYANPNMPGYSGCAIRQRLQALFSCPVSVLNDVQAATLGELHYGIGKKKGLSEFFCLTIGTGIGGALVRSGQLEVSDPRFECKVGSMLIHADERLANPSDIMAGSFERSASTTALVRRVSALDPELNNGKKIFAQIHRPDIAHLVDAWIDELASGILNLALLFNPKVIVMGGGIMQQEGLSRSIETRVNALLPEDIEPLVIENAILGNQAGLWGAVYTALCADLSAQD